MSLFRDQAFWHNMVKIEARIRRGQKMRKLMLERAYRKVCAPTFATYTSS